MTPAATSYERKQTGGLKITDFSDPAPSHALYNSGCLDLNSIWSKKIRHRSLIAMLVVAAAIGSRERFRCPSSAAFMAADWHLEPQNGEEKRGQFRVPAPLYAKASKNAVIGALRQEI